MSKKKLNIDAITNELEGASLFFANRPQPPVQSADQSTEQPTDQSTSELTKQPIEDNTSRQDNLSTSQSSNQSTSRSTKQSTNGSRIVDRPKAFYITERLDRRLDEAVRYLQETHGIKKVDRSTLVNALLDNEETWSEEALDLLVDRVISQLTRRLTGK